MVDLHRHDEFSTFDGFGKATETAARAKELGYTSLGLSNHGNTNGLVKHYLACRDVGIKPILGVESYFLPKYNDEKKRRGFHLCLFAKNKVGYKNLNIIQSEGEKHKYYNSICDFGLLEQYHEGIICTSACVAGYLAQQIVKGRMDLAEKFIRKMQSIFGDDFYIEVQPYKVSEKGLQERINVESIKLAKKFGVKCILTSDSHLVRKDDLPTYIKLHQIAGHDIEWAKNTYAERYMPAEHEIKKRFVKMHKDDFKNPEAMADRMIRNLEELEEKVESDFMGELPQRLPKFDKNEDSMILLKKKIKRGLKRRGKWNRQYVNRIKEELKVIKYHGFEDYFLIVADYTNYAKSNGIYVGPGRGSGCNCLVNYALGITDVDPILFDLDFSRFLRIDKKKMPDIDLDFETARRPEVIKYLVDKYKGHAAQICSYGLYKVDNLINDLAKVCGCDDKEEIKRIKKLCNTCVDPETKELHEDIEEMKQFKIFNAKYDNIMTHFTKLYKKVRFIGTHAAGVAIVSGDIRQYTALKIDSKSGKLFTSYDLLDIEEINVIKFDILGLVTMSSIGELRELTDHEGFDEELVNDEKVVEGFSKGDCDGIFQFDRQAAQELLIEMHTDCFEDVIAASAMNRPGPLSLGMPKIYAENKIGLGSVDKSLPYYKYLEKTYGCVVYQEQTLAISVNIGGLEWPEADKILKMSRGGTLRAQQNFEENYEPFLKKFIKGAKRFGMNKEQSTEIFDSFFNYSFNRGHATGYSLISAEEMYYKQYYPFEFWYVKMKYASSESDEWKFKHHAVESGCLMLTPHVNGTASYSIQEVDGEKCIMEGMLSIKGVGAKAAAAIEEERRKNGPYKDEDDLCERIEKRVLNMRVLRALEEAGALQFNRKKYFNHVERYNTGILSRAR